MAQQMKLYSRHEMSKVMKRDREEFENQKAGELLNSTSFQVRTLAKKGYQVSTIARILGISINKVNRHLLT